MQVSFRLKSWYQHLITKRNMFGQQIQYQAIESFINESEDDDIQLSIKPSCMICFQSSDDLEKHNIIFTCQTCRATFHRFCYDVKQNFEECDVCKAESNIQIVCKICNQFYSNIPMKQINGQFYHIQCALIQYNLSYFNQQFTIIKPHTIMNNKCCFICRDKLGAYVQCRQCNHSCHLLCAFFWGYDIELYPLTLLCPSHDTRNLRDWEQQIYFRWYGINLKNTISYNGIYHFKEVLLETLITYERICEQLE